VPKPGKQPDIPESYRPISLRSVFGKFLEKLLLKSLSIIALQQNVLPDIQFGFHVNHATFINSSDQLTTSLLHLKPKNYY